MDSLQRQILETAGRRTVYADAEAARLGRPIRDVQQAIRALYQRGRLKSGHTKGFNQFAPYSLAETRPARWECIRTKLRIPLSPGQTAGLGDYRYVVEGEARAYAVLAIATAGKPSHWVGFRGPNWTRVDGFGRLDELQRELAK